MKIASIDIGTNAIKSKIFKTTPTSIEFIEGIRSTIRLGSNVFQEGYLKKNKLNELVKALKKYQNNFKENNIKMYAATLQNSNLYTHENYKDASAIIVGTEANGLTKIWREHSTKNINIPMQGEIDSMNVSVAAAILLFEAKRQRNFK